MDGHKGHNLLRSPRFPVQSCSMTEQEKEKVHANRGNEAETSTDMEPKSMIEIGTVVKVPSLCLEFFETDPDEKIRSCKFCSVSYPLTTALGNLGRHLKYFHPGYDKMGDVVSSLPPQPITMVSERGDRMGDAIGRQPALAITAGTADKTGGAVPRSSLQPITTVTKTADKMSYAFTSPLPRSIPAVSKSADKMGDAISSPSPQSITTVSKRVQSRVKHSSIANFDNETCKNMEPQNMTEKGTVTEVASLYLKFFETAPDGKSRSCKFCYQSYPITTAFGNLGRHLKYYHAGYDKMGDVVSSSPPQPITMVSETGGKKGDAIARPSLHPITAGTETADKKGGAVPKSSPPPITSVTQADDKMSNVFSNPLPLSMPTVSKSADKMGDSIPCPQSITTVPNMVQSQVKHSSIVNFDLKTCKNMEPKSMTEIVTVTEVASLYLKFFEAAPDGKSRSCKFCNQSYPIATAYGNLGRHLKYRHPEYDNMGDVLSSPSPPHIATVTEIAGRKGNAVPMPSPQPMTTLTEMVEKKGDAFPRPLPQPITTSPKMAHKGNVTPIAKLTKTSLPSFFETSPDGKSRSCKFCNQSYSIATAIANLQRHLKHRHPDEYDKMGDVISNLSPQPITGASKSSTVDLDHLNWLLLRWLMGGSFPPSALQDKWLLNSFKFVNPMVRIWSNERLQGVIQEVFRSMQEDVKASLELVNSKISLTLDFWTSYEQIFYMSVTGHWIDESWSLHKVLLNISRIPYPCAGTDIYNTIVKVLKMYNVGNKILSCTHDNSQKAIHACHTLKEYLDGRNSMSFGYIPCAARTLNLIIEDGLRTAKPVISKIREFVLELNTSPVIASDFKQTTSAYQEGSWNFPIDISTRWSGNYAMLDIACKASKSMDAVIRKHEESLASSYMLLNPAEIVALSIMHLYLEPFHKTTNTICTSKFPTVGLVLFFMDDVFEMIATCRGSWHAPDWLKSCAEDMAKKGRIYNDQVHNIYTYMTAILDPRIKGELIPQSLKLESNLKEARDYFMKNYSTAHFPTPANGYIPQKNEGGGNVTSSEEINWKRRRVDMSTPTDELNQYLSEAPSPITTDIFDWWKGNSSRYPRLSVMARDFLAVQSTSVSPDELFSRKGDEVDNQRCCLPHASTQPVLCMRAWIESGFKLKYRSVEKLMAPVRRAWY